MTTIVDSFRQEHREFFRAAELWQAREKRNEDLLAFLEDMVRVHFRDEERILYPAMRDATPELIEEYVAAHDEVAHRLEAIRRWSDEGRPVSEDLGWVVEQVKGHARHEEDVFFPAAERHLGAERLRALQRQRPQRKRAPALSLRP